VRGVRTRTRIALLLLAAAVILNVVILVRGEEAAAWPIAAIVLLGAVGASLVAERREP
jgi:hypothetical protein